MGAAAASPTTTLPGTVGELVRRRLREIHRTPAQLAEAVGVTPAYIDELMSGTRRPPWPGRTDIYPRMTTFLRLSRQEITSRATAERELAGHDRGPSEAIAALVLELCEPRTARTLARRAKRGRDELTGLLQRVLDVAQGSVRRSLDDQVGLRIAASEQNSTYLDKRLELLEFLDVGLEALTPDDLARFVRPRIARWDVDLKTGVLRVVLRSTPPRERTRRRPNTSIG